MDLISVIIPAHNEEKYIIPTLKSVLKSTDQNFEIIVVVNGCTDKTRTQTSSIHDTKIRSYIIPEAAVSKARNHGASHAKGNILVFLDADTHPSKNALNLIRQNTDNNTIGTLKIYPDSKKLFGRILFFLKNIVLKYFPINVHQVYQ